MPQNSRYASWTRSRRRLSCTFCVVRPAVRNAIQVLAGISNADRVLAYELLCDYYLFNVEPIVGQTHCFLRVLERVVRFPFRPVRTQACARGTGEKQTPKLLLRTRPTACVRDTVGSRGTRWSCLLTRSHGVDQGANSFTVVPVGGEIGNRYVGHFGLDPVQQSTNEWYGFNAVQRIVFVTMIKIKIKSKPGDPWSDLNTKRSLRRVRLNRVFILHTHTHRQIYIVTRKTH